MTAKMSCREVKSVYISITTPNIIINMHFATVARLYTKGVSYFIRADENITNGMTK